MNIGVLVRGDITNKIYQAWENNVPKKFSGATISSSYAPPCDVIVCGKSSTADTLRNWMKPYLQISEDTDVVYSDWMVTSLKSGRLLPMDTYRAPFSPKADNGSGSNTVTTNVRPPVKSTTVPTQSPAVNVSDALGPSPQSVPQRLDSHVNSDEAPSQLQMHDADETNRNKHITDILDELHGMYLQMGDQFRAQNYKKSANQLKRMKHIRSANELDGITGFGKSLKTTIQEILETGTLRKLSHLKKNPRSAAITKLSEIWGVGEKTAEQLYNQGFETVDDLRARGQHLLNRQQRIGLKHYEDILTRMPRAEVNEIAGIVEEEMKRIDPQVMCTVCGSYRRGKSDCGDIDILITPADDHPQDSLPGNSLSRLILALEQRGLLTDHLSLPTGHKEYVAASALAHIQQIHSSSSRAGSTYAGSKAPSRRSSASGRAPSLSSAPAQRSQAIPLSPGGTQTSIGGYPQAPLSFSPPQSIGRRLNGPALTAATTQEATQLDATQPMEGDVHSDDPPTDSEGEGLDGNYSDFGFTDDGEEGYGTQSDDGFDPEEGVVKYDTYGGKRRKTQHRLYFGSRGSYMGVCRLPHPGARYRRIDIKIYPREQRAFALFYFTGSDAYNRGVRYYASKNGFALDDKGLMVCVRDDKNKIVSRGELVPCATEQDICDQLGIQYREPWDRGMFDPKTQVLRPLGPAKYGKWSANWRGKATRQALTQSQGQSQALSQVHGPGPSTHGDAGDSGRTSTAGGGGSTQSGIYMGDASTLDGEVGLASQSPQAKVLGKRALSPEG